MLLSPGQQGGRWGRPEPGDLPLLTVCLEMSPSPRTWSPTDKNRASGSTEADSPQFQLFPRAAGPLLRRLLGSIAGQTPGPGLAAARLLVSGWVGCRLREGLTDTVQMLSQPRPWDEEWGGGAGAGQSLGGFSGGLLVATKGSAVRSPNA